MNYAIAIHQDDGSDYGVTVPDLPGCFTAGRTLDEALAMAREAIELHLEGMIEEGEPLPDAKPIQTHQTDPDYADATWAVIQIDSSALPQKAKRINITLPERVLAAADRFADEEGLTRSGLIARSVAMFIHSSKLQTEAIHDIRETGSDGKGKNAKPLGRVRSGKHPARALQNKAGVSKKATKTKAGNTTSRKKPGTRINRK